MPDAESIQVTGTVLESLPEALYRVELPNGHRLLAHLAGKARMGFSRFAAGDRVRLELSAFDLSHGRITGAVEESVENK
jgi:translation initiation factor IF-1